MISDLNMYKIYEAIIEGKELTTQELKSYGFSSDDLTKLVKDRVLTRIKRGYYAIGSVDRLYLYGKRLISLKQHEKATRCFEKCYELNPEHKATNFQLFLRYVRSKKYDLAFEKLDVLLNDENDNYKRDAYLYLCLLSYITVIPSKYRFIIGSLNYDDIKVWDGDKRFENIRIQNNIRLASFVKNPSYALRQYHIYEGSAKRITAFDILLKELLTQAQQAKKDNINTILKFIEDKDYNKIVEFLKNMEENCFSLSEFEYEILTLAKTLTMMAATNAIPEKSFVGTNKYDIAIKNKDYELALKLYSDSRKQSQLPENMDIIYLLLTEINALILELQTHEQIKDNNSQTNNEIKPFVMEPKLPIEEQLINYAIKELSNNNIDIAFRAIYCYLAMFDKSEYEFLVVNLIKISLIEKDMTFSNPINILKSISDDSYVFDENEYIKYLYEALIQKESEKVNLYLDIIIKANEPITGILNCEFEDKKEHYNYRRNQAIRRISVASRTLGVNYAQFVDGVKKSGIEFNRFAIGNMVVTNPDKFLQLAEISAKKTSPIVPGINMDVSVDKPQTKSTEDVLLQKKVAELKQGKGFVILGEANNEQLQSITGIIRKKYNDVSWFVVGEDEIKTVVIKHRVVRKERVNFSHLIAEANKAYNTCNYELCIAKCKELLSLSSYPKAVTFAKIGLSYLKQSKIKAAIKYLSMATMMSKYEEKDDRYFDFTDTIERLGGKVKQDDKDPFITKKINVREEDFESTSNNYGITNFDAIVSLISEQNISIDEACAQFDLAEEKVSLVKLLFARNYYAQGDYVTGDRFVKHVEQSPCKTPLVLQIIDELRRNKKFYKNRNQNDIVFVKK